MEHVLTDVLTTSVNALQSTVGKTALWNFMGVMRTAVKIVEHVDHI